MPDRVGRFACQLRDNGQELGGGRQGMPGSGAAVGAGHLVERVSTQPGRRVWAGCSVANN